jgi:hypothetical protein
MSRSTLGALTRPREPPFPHPALARLVFILMAWQFFSLSPRKHPIVIAGFNTRASR